MWGKRGIAWLAHLPCPQLLKSPHSQSAADNSTCPRPVVPAQVVLARRSQAWLAPAGGVPVWHFELPNQTPGHRFFALLGEILCQTPTASRAPPGGTIYKAAAAAAGRVLTSCNDSINCSAVFRCKFGITAPVV